MTAVSVVVAAFEEERWIGACLRSLADQTHPDYEVIVVDDGSRDATPEIAASHGARVIRAPHRGCGAARAAGARQAGGHTLVFLDADEWYAPDFLELLVAPLSDPAVRGTFPGDVRWANPSEGLAPGWLRVRGLRPGGKQRYGDSHPFPKAVRRADLERAGGYPGGGYGEDAALGEALGEAIVVHAARWHFTLPTRAGEVFAKARWMGRSPQFARDPRLAELLPHRSWSRAAALLLERRPRAAAVRVLYDAGRLLGFVEGRVSPKASARAPRSTLAIGRRS